MRLPVVVSAVLFGALSCNSTTPGSQETVSTGTDAVKVASREGGHEEGGQCADGKHHGHDAAHHEGGGDHHAAGTDREAVDADGVVRRGTALTSTLAAMPVSSAFAKAKELDGQKVKLTGKVQSVCTKMGCWFVVQGDKPEDKIRISTKAHNIFVPRASVGMTATVEGTLQVKTLTAKTAQHYEDERELAPGEERKTFTTDVTELGIDVIGLELTKS